MISRLLKLAICLTFIISYEIISQNIVFNKLNIPPRPINAVSGSEFINSVKNLSIEERENRVYAEISNGNIPDFLRELKKINSTFYDAAGKKHSVIYEVLPDYLSIGSNEDYCRIPMGPITAQKIADLFGASLPTSKLVDDIYLNSEIKLEPVTYPWSIESINPLKFLEHSKAIDNQLAQANASLGQLVGGIKKDVILSNKITDPTRTHHVVIYGWHQLNGVPIQPIYNGHINTYMDYSHGIRLINSQFYIDSIATDYKIILTDEILYKLLSNEFGVMTQPSYLNTKELPEKPNSFGILNNGSDKLKIIIKQDQDVDYYKVFFSRDGEKFFDPLSFSKNEIIIDGLSEDSTYFIKLKAVNSKGESLYSEVLSGIPSSNINRSLLIVNGFDRLTQGNTFNFIRQHSLALKANNKVFDSATNEAIVDGIINLTDYFLIDYLLGEESTEDETFSSEEQALVSNYLKEGGNLFVSGSEIAWDLDFKGTSEDKDFIWNYLKIKYISDAPFDEPGTYYDVGFIQNQFISYSGELKFDDGTNGTYNVRYPDVIFPNEDATGFLKYSSLSEQIGYAGILYDGLFPNGVSPGKLIVLGFPFETIYNVTNRNNFMEAALDFFYSITDIAQTEKVLLPSSYNLYQNYPNPFNLFTTINYNIAEAGNVKLLVFNTLGEEVIVIVNEYKDAGNYHVPFDAGNLTSGVYFYKLISGNYSDVKKMVLLE